MSANSELQQRLQERINRVSVPAAAAVSVDRRTPAITETERDLMLRNAVMQMQIESLASEGIHPADEGVRLQ